MCVCATGICAAIYFNIVACRWEAVGFWKTSEILKGRFSMLTCRLTRTCCEFGYVPASKVWRDLFSSLQNFGSLVGIKATPRSGDPKLCYQKQMMRDFCIIFAPIFDTIFAGSLAAFLVSARAENWQQWPSQRVVVNFLRCNSCSLSKKGYIYSSEWP